MVNPDMFCFQKFLDPITSISSLVLMKNETDFICQCCVFRSIRSRVCDRGCGRFPGLTGDCLCFRTQISCGLLSSTLNTGKKLHGFSSGRELSAWCGLVPRQHSSGGKQKLSSVTKMAIAV
ncbi:transposase [Buttiauxella ferragutiae]|uniref:transposase n=1 Tax=Buttiauxella ferragutiae TaxID=82989 RepID=UPI0035264587